MYSSYCLPKCLVSIPILAIQILFIHSVSSLNLTNEYLNHKCLDSQGKYKPGSTYEENLNHLFSHISKDRYTHQDGNVHVSHGKDSNSVTVILQCRGDSFGSNCRSCIATAIAGFRKRCPRNKGGTIWYDQCFMDVNMIDAKSPRKINYESIFSLQNPNNVNENTTSSFNKNMRDFLHSLILKADKTTPNGLKLFYAAGEKNLGTTKLYAMAQCARDTFDCKGCLEWSLRELSKCCSNKQGARVLGLNCILRYELYPFLRT